MRGLAAKAFARGMNVVRLNQRNCGDTEQLSAGLFHSGLTADAAHVVDELTRVDGLPAIAVAGYSLGGNLALKLAGEYGAHAPAALACVAAVSPIIEIEACVRALERPANVLYQWNFVKDLKRRMRRKERFWPGLFDLSAASRGQNRARVRRGVHGAVLRLRERRGLLPSRERDARHRSHPRAGADHHRRGRSVRAVAAVPRSEDRGNPHIELRVLPRTADTADSSVLADAEDDGYWAETKIVEFVERHARLKPRATTMQRETRLGRKLM